MFRFVLCFVRPHLIARLNRAIHLHIFSRLTGAQYTDCIACCTSTHFVLVCTTITISPLLVFLSFNMPVYVSFLIFHIFPSQCALIGSAKQPWTATEKGQPYYFASQRASPVPIRFLAHIHVCPTLPY